MTVIDLAAAREERTPHLGGPCRCLDCKHEWHGIAPVGRLWLECPACTLIRGRFIGAAEQPVPVWHCDCGNDLFQVRADYIVCPNCGNRQDPS